MRAVTSVAERLFGRAATGSAVVVSTPPPTDIPLVSNPERFGCHPKRYPRAFHARQVAGICMLVAGAVVWFTVGAVALVLGLAGFLLIVSAPNVQTWLVTEDARVQLDARAELLRRQAEFTRVFTECMQGDRPDDRTTLDLLLRTQSDLQLHDEEIDEYQLAVLYALSAAVGNESAALLQAAVGPAPGSLRSASATERSGRPIGDRPLDLN